ncbi:MAG: DUF2786 domain-containing protein [Acidimicrobiia bacterium]
MEETGQESEASVGFAAAVQAARFGDRRAAERLIGALAARSMGVVAPEVAAEIESRIAYLWRHGWQPADVARVVDRELGKPESALIRLAIASESQSYAALGEKVAPGWMAQLRRIDAVSASNRRAPYLIELGVDWSAALHSAVRVMIAITRLPPLHPLTDPPSEWRDGLTVASGSLPAGVLGRVRALLAKAESTTFDAEAEALTAKAQELMARHRIDRAVLDASSRASVRSVGEEPVGRRIGIDDPYSAPKAVLLFRVAEANGCQAVWSKGFGFMTVFGFASELDAVEELFTSLLVQATAALRRAGPKQDAHGRSRTKSFRRSFLIAFAVRIGQRLLDAVDAVVEAVSIETGTALVPILTARADATAAVAHAAFPKTSRFAPSATDSEGWHAGTVFANQAELSVVPRLTRRSA